jgi:hypothetical protein
MKNVSVCKLEDFRMTVFSSLRRFRPAGPPTPHKRSELTRLPRSRLAGRQWPAARRHLQQSGSAGMIGGLDAGAQPSPCP